MKISKKVREEAALICAIAASGGAPMASPFNGLMSIGYSEIAAALGWCGRYGSCPASRLAFDARSAVYAASVWGTNVDAEAESLLRTGWIP